MSDINVIREELDKIDRQIVSLLNLRMEKIEFVKSIKEKTESSIYDPIRESAIASRIVSMNKDLDKDKYISDESLLGIYREILKFSKSLQGEIHFYFLDEIKEDLLFKVKHCFGSNNKFLVIDSLEDYFSIGYNSLNSILIVSKHDYLDYISSSFVKVCSSILDKFFIVNEIILNSSYYLVCPFSDNLITNTSKSLLRPIYGVFNFSNSRIENSNILKDLFYNENISNFYLDIFKNILLFSLVNSEDHDILKNILKELTFSGFSYKIVGYFSKYYYYI